MTYAEYLEALETEKYRHYREVKRIQREYALSNNTIVKGDILTDHYKTIKVEKITVAVGLSGNPECIYSGQRLTKQLIPFKSKEVGVVHQSNIKKVMQQ